MTEAEEPGTDRAAGEDHEARTLETSLEAITLIATSSSTDVGASESELALGFDRYERHDTLGTGGMGRILLCTDARVGRKIAMKVVHAEMGHRLDMRARFLVEARVQGQLEHPAIVPVYDLGIDPGGALYFTMRRVRGRTLEQVLTARTEQDAAATHALSTRRLLADFSKLCLAIDFVHEHGVIHRDLKPANVMLGDYGEVYLLDWGLAKVLGHQDQELEAPTEGVDLGDSGPAKTSYGTILGTPGYMSPEQARSKSEGLDARSDVYGLGSILFEILCGEKLHRGNTRKVLVETMTGVEGRPSVRAPGREVPPELEDMIVGATALDPEERLGSARELHEAIERYLDGDRDIARRRTLAAQLVEDAEADAELALSHGDESARRRVLRSLGHALALDPDNRAALRSMVALLTEPPSDLPAEVRAELDELEVRQTRGAGRVGTVAFLSLNLWVPVVLLVGDASLAPLAAFCVATNITALTSWWVSRLDRPRTSHAMAVLVLGLLTASISSAMFGPFVLAPSIIVVLTLLFALNHPPQWRWGIIMLGLMAMLVPWGLELVGVLPPSMAFPDDGVLLLPRLVRFSAIPTLGVLLVANAVVIITAGVAMAPIRRELDEAQARIRLSAWQLRQLVPEDVSEKPRS